MTGNHESRRVLAAGDPHGELLRAVRVCHPSWESVRRLTFVPDRSAPGWNSWLAGIFTPVLLPQLHAARLALAAGDASALQACERALEAGLPAGARAASAAAGSALARDFTVPNAEKSWLKYRDLVLAEKTPGHLAVVLALRSSAFHLAPASLTAAYVLLEARGGLPRQTPAVWMQMVDDCLLVKGTPVDAGLRAA